METYSLRNKVVCTVSIFHLILFHIELFIFQLLFKEQIASSSSSYIEPSDTVDEAAESDDTSPVTPKNKQITKKYMLNYLYINIILILFLISE
jgi:hypothetical protein